MTPEKEKLIIRNMVFEPYKSGVGPFLVSIVGEKGLWNQSFETGRHVLHEKTEEKYDYFRIRQVDEYPQEPIPEGYRPILRDDVKAEAVFIMNLKNGTILHRHNVFENQQLPAQDKVANLVNTAGQIATRVVTKAA